MNQRLSLAGCIIKNLQGKILLLHRNTPQRKQWETPGGKIESNENPKNTAVREVEEELGIKVEILSEAGRHEFAEDKHMMDYIWYNAIIISGIPKPMEEKHDKVKYFPWSELKNMTEELSPNTKNLVESYFANQLRI